MRRYTWNEWTKRVNPPEPTRVTEPFAPFLRPGATRIDLTYKASVRVCLCVMLVVVVGGG